MYFKEAVELIETEYIFTLPMSTRIIRSKFLTANIIS
jgi:hypothetical protein